MAPDPGAAKEKLRTVGVAFVRLVPDAAHAAAIRDAVDRTHHTTLLATELLNLYVRDRLANHGGGGLADVFNANWLLNAYNEVTFARGKPKVFGELRATRDAHMPAFEAVDRTGLSQVFKYECRNLAAVASNNVWMHLRRRVLSHVKLKLALDDAAFAALTKEQRRARRLALMQVADDLLRPPSQPPRCPEVHRAWVAAEPPAPPSSSPPPGPPPPLGVASVGAATPSTVCRQIALVRITREPTRRTTRSGASCGGLSATFSAGVSSGALVSPTYWPSSCECRLSHLSSSRTCSPSCQVRVSSASLASSGTRGVVRAASQAAFIASRSRFLAKRPQLATCCCRECSASQRRSAGVLLPTCRRARTARNSPPAARWLATKSTTRSRSKAGCVNA